MVLAYYEAYLASFEEWVDITLRNGVGKVAPWISNRIVHTSCGLSMLHPSGGRLRVVAGRPAASFSDSRTFPGFPPCAGNERESHGLGSRSVSEKSPKGPNSEEQVLSESDARALGKTAKTHVRAFMWAGGRRVGEARPSVRG